MQPQPQIIFDPFRIDLANECLWRGDQPIPLTPKAFALLKYLAGRPDQLATKEELLNAVWPETYVSDAALKVCIGELRKALGDDAKRPRFIETAHRRGYRFIGKVKEVSDRATQGWSPRLRAAAPSATVGRGSELARLQGWLKRALGGQRQTVFVTGEPGIGKTTLVEAFLHEIVGSGLFVTRGQCLEQYGAGEAYLPILEALSWLCREPGHERLIQILRRRAPMWLMQMPWLVGEAERDALQRETAGATRERMMREMSQALETLTSVTPLVLVLEDLHWSDYSTLDLLSSLARKSEPARLLLIGTYRPVEVLASGHPLNAVKQELKMRRQCEELALDFLSKDSVADYLAARFPGSRLPTNLTTWIHERTDGNPLFMVNVVDYLVDRGLIVQAEGEWELKAEAGEPEMEVPENTRQMIENQIDRLSGQDRRMLETASVVGVEFSASAVAAALKADVIHIEEQCEELARRHQFLKTTQAGQQPDAPPSGRYGFIHSLYRNVLYGRISAARRAHLHGLIGEHEEARYGARAGEFAVELAMHFEQARDFGRAVKYLRQAGDNALGRFAPQEASALARRGLELLKNLPDAAERTHQELGLQMILCAVLPVIEGYGAAEVETAYKHARELCQQLGESIQLFRVLQGLRAFYLFRAKLDTARETCDQLLDLAESARETDLLVQAHWAMSQVLFHLGEFSRAADHCGQGLTLYDPRRRRSHLLNHRYDPGTVLRGCGSWIEWFLGYPDRSLKKSRESVRLAREAAHPENLCITIFYASFLHQFRREAQRALEQAEALIALAGEHGLKPWVLIGTSLRGWALADQGRSGEGIGLIRQSLSAHGKAGSEIALLGFSRLLAEALMKHGQIQEGLAVLDGALEVAHRTGGRCFNAELYRLKGELLLKSEVTSPQSEAECCFRQAIEISRQQQAKSLELRAAMNLSRLWKEQGKSKEARQLVMAEYNWFTEGFDTEDLKEAKALGEQLS